MLGAELLGGEDLAGAARALAGFPSDPDPRFSGLDLSLLGGDIGLLADGLELPLLHEGENNGLLELGSAGALTSFAHTESATDAVASSGVLDENGAIAFDANEEPPEGTTTASVDATALLDALGLGPAAGGIVDELALEIGAVASHGEEIDDVFTSDYRVADLTFELDSPAVGELVSTLNGSLGTVEGTLQTSLEGALGETGILNTVISNLGNVSVLGLASVDLDDAQAVVDVPDLSDVVNTALSGEAGSEEIILTSDDGAIAINLTAGTVSLNLANLVSSIEREDPDAIGLNGFGPNTELLTPEVLSAITTGVTSALSGIVEPVTDAVELALEDTSIAINIPLDVDLLIGLVPVADGSININGSLRQIIDGDPTTITAPLTLLPGAGGIQLTPLTNAVITSVATPILSGIGATLDGLLTTADTGVNSAIGTLNTGITNVLGGLTPVFDGLGDVATITVNVQPPGPPAPGMVTPFAGTESGDLAGGYTVRALTLTLLPNLPGSNLANLDFASSSVSNVEPTAVPGTLVLDPDRAHDGDTVAISGDGWNGAGDVTVTFTDVDGTTVGEPVVITPVDGVIDGEYLVPEGIDAQTLTATAEQEDASTTAELVVFNDPTVVVDPDPVDPGETITISGSDFACGPVTVTITGGPEPVVIADLPVADDGTWSTTYDVPADIDANTLTISAVATGDCGDEAETPVEVDQPESLELAPGQVRIGDDVTIDGDGWATGSDVTVTFTDSTDTVVGTPVTITPTGAAGTIDGTFTVPAGTANGVLTGSATQGEDSSTDSVTVFGEPTVIVDPDPVDPGETITISGSGYLCGPVTVTISDGDTVLETIEDIEVAADGTWSTTYDVPADVDASTLTINASAPGDCGEEEVPVDIDQPETLELAPGEVRGGDEITIDGTGWEGDGPVTVVFTDADDQPIGEPVVIDPVDGTIDGTFTVPPGTPAGPITGTATRDDDSAEDTVQLFGTATVSVDPTSVRAGGTVDIDGTGWLPTGGDVTVTFTDGTTTIGAPVVIDEISTEGVIAGTFTVPAGTDPATLTVTAVQGDATALDTLAVVADPSIELDPTTARPGDTVDVDGEGWADGTVTVIFTDGDVQVGETLTLPVTAGVISGTYTVPADADAGTLTATATQGEDEATAELEITLAPTVSASPPQLHGGDSVTIGGSGWGDDDVTVTITDGTTTIGTPLTITPVDGVLTGTYPIPEGTDVGELTVTATDGADTAEDTVEIVADPTVTVDPDPADPGQQVLISGDGFLCGPVTVTISDGTTTLDTIEDLAVIDGAWSTFWTVPLDVDADTLTITAVATGECGDEGETDLEVDLVETLTATPAFVEVGDVVTLAGTGWADGIVSITATDSDGTNVGTFTATSADAAFSRTFTVPPNADLGALEFEATQGESVETATVTVVSIPAPPASLIVSPSAVEPGDDVALDGEGWDPTAGPVSVTFSTLGGTTVGTAVVQVREDGRLLTGSFTVPAGTSAPQVLDVDAVQGPRTASDTLELREADLPVIRLGGPTRIEVAVEISRDAYPFGTRTVFVASAEKFPDALSAAPAAAQLGAPILLTSANSVPAIVQQELDRLEPDRIVVVGGPATVAPSTFTTLSQYAPDTIRIGGPDRYAVSQAIAEFAFDGATTAYIASGRTFPDALTAGAAAGANDAPMLLTYGSTPPPSLIDTLEELGVETVYVAGGPITIPQSNITALRAAGFDVERIDGATRYHVGVNVAQQFDGPVDRLYVATGVRFPDALAGSAVAGAQGNPVYVSPVTCLWTPIPSEVDRLGDPQIVLLGGTSSLNEDVFDLQTC